MTEPTDGERAAFEAGIKFGTLYHQFAGTPVSPDSAASLARAMEESIENQPFCTDVTVEVHDDRLREAIGLPTGDATDGASDGAAIDDAADRGADATDADATDSAANATDADATDVAAYTELTGTLFDATIDVERADHAVRACLETEDEYPLMELERVERPE